MPVSPPQPATQEQKAATTATIVMAFASVYFFWGSTYTAIRVAAAEMPALLLAGIRFSVAGVLLLAWCRWRGLRLVWPAKSMLLFCLIGLLLLGGGNVGLIYAEETLPSGMASLVFAVTPLYVALMEMARPGGEPLPRRGWLGLVLGFLGLSVLVWPSLRVGLAGNGTLLWALGALLAGALSWSVGSLVSRHARLKANSFVAAAWQMLAAGAFSAALGTGLGQWPRVHLNAAAIVSLIYLITGGSLLGYTGFIYLLEHVPVAKVMSYTYVNPVVAVVLGMILLHERPAAEEFAGMAAIVLAVFLLSTAEMQPKTGRRPIEETVDMHLD
ncbi:MAG: EamA family transporter [Terracidiphilus sp.]